MAEGGGPRALIVGGGIGGLAAALALRAAGVEAHVYEQAPEISEIGAGLSVWSNGSKALDLLGLGERWRSVAVPLRRAETRRPDGRVLGTLDVTKVDEALGRPSVAAHRGELLGLLRDALSPAAIHTDERCSGFRTEGTDVVATFVDGSEARGTFLIGADGISSEVRRRLWPEAWLRYAGYATWRGVTAIAPPKGWPQRALVRTVGRGEYFGIGEISSGRFLWYATKNLDERATEAGGRRETLLRHFGGWHEPVRELLESTPEEEMLLHRIYKMKPLRRWGEGRITLLGDAAHPIEPSLGMGASLALEDAVVLALSVRGTADPASALRWYEAVRRKRVGKVVRTSATLAKSEQSENRAVGAARDLSSRATPERVIRRLWRSLVAFDPEIES